VQRDAELKQMYARTRDAQLVAHLSQHLIEVAAIPDIGPSLIGTLRANGITSALDIQGDRIRRIPRFGPARTANLIDWRRNIEATFLFKFANAIPAHEMKKLETKYDHIRQLLQGKLLAGEKELRKISQDAEKHLAHLSIQIKVFRTNLCQAEVDAAFIPEGL
jgi:DNA-binding helix-hairpin-helix protein with protein kinase domain